jgi:hypothetical protein
MHYTLQSGQRTDTVTARCPLCGVVTYTSYDIATQHSPIGDGCGKFCCNNHGHMFDDKLMGLLTKAATVYGKLHTMRVQAAIEEKNLAGMGDLITRYIVEYGQ